MSVSKVFVIRDFEVDKTVGLALEYLAENPPEGSSIIVPGSEGAATQGSVLDDVITAAIDDADYVLAFMDIPNANVGFELGLALGKGKKVALVSASTVLSDWLNGAPISGYLVNLGVELEKLETIISKREYIQVEDEPARGREMFFLCPHEGEGLVGHAIVREKYDSWSVPEPRGWTLKDLSARLRNVREIVWVITPFARGADEKDGQANALNAIIAGYARALNIPLHILKSEHHRTIADIKSFTRRFGTLSELQELMQEAEEKRIGWMVETTAEEEPAGIDLNTQLERIVGADSFKTVNWYQKSLAMSDFVGRLNVHGRMLASCTLIAPDRVLTGAHVVPESAPAEGCTVFFERLGTEREVRSLLWTSGSAGLDATILELSAPVETANPPPAMPTDLENGLVLGTPVYVIGYPGGTALSISTAQKGIVDFDRRFVHYMANTAPGSTGSAVFDENWRFIAMHHAARPGDDGRRIGEGVRTDAIARESAGRFD